MHERAKWKEKYNGRFREASATHEKNSSGALAIITLS